MNFYKSAVIVIEVQTMIVQHDISLKKYTTFKMGGIAREFVTPENTEEMCNLIKEKKTKYLLGGGSNIVISGQSFDSVVNIRQFNTKLEHMGDGVYYVGASVRLQKLINYINDDGYGGIEYLYSVPGLLGGAIYMNAGRGKAHNKSISDFVKRVEVFYQGKRIWLPKDVCSFGYRSSVFQNGQYVILGAEFHFVKTTKDECENKKIERLELCQRVQDSSGPNFGTVFCVSCSPIMQLVRIFRLGKRNGVHFSSKTANWMINEGGSFQEFEFLIKCIKLAHKLLFQKCKTEVVIWKEEN